jgi:hypothetical protein
VLAPPSGRRMLTAVVTPPKVVAQRIRIENCFSFRWGGGPMASSCRIACAIDHPQLLEVTMGPIMTTSVQGCRRPPTWSMPSPPSPKVHPDCRLRSICHREREGVRYGQLTVPHPIPA